MPRFLEFFCNACKIDRSSYYVLFMVYRMSYHFHYLEFVTEFYEDFMFDWQNFMISFNSPHSPNIMQKNDYDQECVHIRHSSIFSVVFS